ncbi:MAG: type II CAAX endopeptidase family protein [Anaerolineae bacterium]
MKDQSVQREVVPWTTQDVWLGVGAFGVWLLTAFALALLMRSLSWRIDIGVFITLWELALVVPAWWLTVRKYNVSWSALGLRGFGGRTLGIGCGLMLLSFGFNLVYSSLLSLFGLQAQIDWVALFGEVSSPVPLLFGGVLVAPLVEEIFFRGFVFAGLRKRYGWKPAGLISAGLFAVVHLQPLAVVPILILGMIFAYLYHRSESIWPAVVMHVLTNGIGLGAAYLITQLDAPVG